MSGTVALSFGNFLPPLPDTAFWVQLLKVLSLCCQQIHLRLWILAPCQTYQWATLSDSLAVWAEEAAPAGSVQRLLAGASREENVKNVWLLSGPGSLGKPVFWLPHWTVELGRRHLASGLALLLVSCGPDRLEAESQGRVGGNQGLNNSVTIWWGKENKLHFTACDLEEAIGLAMEVTESCYSVCPSPAHFHMNLFMKKGLGKHA